MRKAILAGSAAVLALVATAAPVQAQCPVITASNGATDPDRLTADACRKASDIVQLMVPQIGAVMAGGNASPSIGGTLGGFPHFNVGVRLNAVQGVLPRVDRANPGIGFAGPQASNIPVDDVILAMPQVDAQIGLFRGFKLGLPLPFLGLSNVFGVDALLSAAYLPSVSASAGGSGIALEGGQLAIGYGARLGILEETFLAPGVSVSYMRRPTPEVSLIANAANDTLAVRGLKVNTSSIRLTASKTIPIIGIGISAGIGRDVVDGTAELGLTVNPLAPLPTNPVRRTFTTSAPSVTRDNVFVGASLKVLIVRLAAEVGYVSGGVNPALTNAFLDGTDLARPMDRRRYATISARIGL